MMINVRLLATAGVGLLSLASANAIADSGLYVGAGIGAATLSDDVRLVTLDDEADTWRVNAGLQLGNHLSLDAGYHDFGRLAVTDLIGTPGVRPKLTLDGWTFGGTLAFPVSPELTLFGRGGVFLWDAVIDANGLRNSLSDDSDPYYGAGAKFAVTRKFAIVGDWARFEFDDADADVFSLGVEYRFGN